MTGTNLINQPETNSRFSNTVIDKVHKYYKYKLNI